MAESPAQRPAPRGGTSRTLKLMSAVGVFAAALIAVCVNVLVARFYQRWDWTSQGLYTLSQATLDTLHALDERLEVVVFLSKSDPLTLSVQHMLTAYDTETRQLEARYVDPDRQPAQFIALQQKYGILAGKTEDGRVVTDASIVVARGERHWFITSDELVVFDERDGRARPRLEQALTAAIRNVMEREKATICFSTGHQEINVESGGPTGLAELRHRLEKNNYQVESIELGKARRLRGLDACRVLVIAGPEQPFSETASQRVFAYLGEGGSVFILADPILGDDERIQSTGLEAVARLGGIEFGDDFIVERDDSLRLPTGVGETYFATPEPHEITRGVLERDLAALRPLLSVSQSLRAAGEGAPSPLLVTSQQAFSVRDVRPFHREGKPPEPGEGDRRGPLTVAMAAELGKPAGSRAAHGPRLVVVGTANVAWGRNWHDPTALGNRLFVESALSWLAARPAIVSVPEKASHDVGLSLTEESLGELLRYVLLYLPAAAVALGLFVMLRRRSQERRSRRRQAQGGQADTAGGEAAEREAAQSEAEGDAEEGD